MYNINSVVLSSINNLKSVQLFKLVLWYDYSIVLRFWHEQCSSTMYIYVCVLPRLCLNVIQEVITHTDSAALQWYNNIMLKKCEVNKKQHYCMCEQSFHIKKLFTKIQ